jgi:6,7-dimethyl-8-ribityllumazine synthase
MAAPRPAEAEDIAALVSGARVLVVEARFYDELGAALLAGAQAMLARHEVRVTILRVPGALEIPAMIAMAQDAAAARGMPYDAVVALGCIIRGETYHFEIVANESARALMALSVDRRLPLGNGILTVDTEAQAWERARADRLDKGGGAAFAALQVLAHRRRLEADR